MTRVGGGSRTVEARDGRTTPIVRILIGTVGGQGGGVLSDWLVRGLRGSGWFAQSIGVLGLAQRAGTVTYYVEAAATADRLPVSMYPFPGGVDIVVGQELLELARLLRGGFAAQDCTVIGNRYRYYATLEKMPARGGIYPSEAVVQAAETLSADVHLVDVGAALKAAGLPELASNAMLLGMIVASRHLRLPPTAFRAAIAESGVDPNANVAAFDLGYAWMASGQREQPAVVGQTIGGAALTAARAARLDPRERGVYEGLVAAGRTLLGDTWEPLLAEACYRLLDFQDAAYVREYFDRILKLRRVLEAIGDRGEASHDAIAQEFARILALWMTYEDLPRVAQLKTKPERFREIRARYGVQPGQTFVVTDFLAPDGPQLVGMLPAAVMRLLTGRRGSLPRWLQAWRVPMRLRSTSLGGYLALRLVAAGRRWRRRSFRHQSEMAAIARWEAGINRAAAEMPDLVGHAVRAGDLVKGYGHVRDAALADLWLYLEEILPAIARAPELPEDERVRLADEALDRLGRAAGQGAEVAAWVGGRLAAVRPAALAGSETPSIQQEVTVR
jgi:indolepyruvate ferredoxin oxidoreductase beta subunit